MRSQRRFLLRIERAMNASCRLLLLFGYTLTGPFRLVRLFDVSIQQIGYISRSMHLVRLSMIFIFAGMTLAASERLTRAKLGSSF